MAVSWTIDFTGCFHGDDGWICPYFVSSAVKNSPANAGDTGNMSLIPGSGRCPGVEIGNSLQYSCLGNTMDRGVWCATVDSIAKSWVRVSHSTYTHTYTKWRSGS